MGSCGPCGCRVEESPSILRIVYCPLHAAAPEMLAACNEALKFTIKIAAEGFGHLNSAMMNTHHLLFSAIARAEGGQP